MTSRDQKARATRGAILDTALDLFVRDGFEATSMDAVALAAGVAKGTLYYHYRSKEGILDAALERYARAMEARLDQIEADRRLGFPDKLEAFTRAVKEVSSATFARLHHVRFIDIHDKTAAVLLERCAPYLARIIEDGNRSGACRVEQPLEVAEILLAASHTLVDPEAGLARHPRRVEALSWLAARIFGLGPEDSRRIYRPLAGQPRGRSPSVRRPRRA